MGDVSAIRVSLQLGGGIRFLWEDTMYLSGRVDCILLSNVVRSYSLILGRECSTVWRRLVALLRSEGICGISSIKVVSCTHLIGLLRGCESVKWPTREYSQTIGFQSHRTDLVFCARDTNNERVQCNIPKEREFDFHHTENLQSN